MNTSKKPCWSRAPHMPSFSFRMSFTGNPTWLRYRRSLKNGQKHKEAGATYGRFLTLRIFKLNCLTWHCCSNRLIRNGEWSWSRLNNHRLCWTALISIRRLKTLSAAMRLLTRWQRALMSTCTLNSWNSRGSSSSQTMTYCTFCRRLRSLSGCRTT